MRRFRVGIITVGALVAAACGGGTTEPDPSSHPTVVPGTVDVTIAAGQTVAFSGGALRLTFVRVVEDSRCPVDVTCVWAGNAVVEIGAALGSGPVSPLQINSGVEPRHVDWKGVRIQVVELTPLPREGRPVPAGEYTVHVRVEPLVTTG